MQRLRSEAGFTLVEMLVTTIIIAILALTLTNFVVNWLQASTRAQLRSDLLANAQNALDTITNDIRLSGSADDDNRWADDNSPSGDYGWASGSQVLVLAKATVDKSNNIIFSDPSKYITQKDNQVYYLSSGTLYRRTIAAPEANNQAVTSCPPASATPSCPADRKIATDVTAFAVSYYDADDAVVTPTNARSIQLSITLKKKQDVKDITASYSTRMVFRNE